MPLERGYSFLCESVQFRVAVIVYYYIGVSFSCFGEEKPRRSPWLIKNVYVERMRY